MFGFGSCLGYLVWLFGPVRSGAPSELIWLQFTRNHCKVRDISNNSLVLPPTALELTHKTTVRGREQPTNKRTPQNNNATREVSAG